MKTPKDARSTGRKRGRAVLEKIGRPFECACEDKTHTWHTGKCGWRPVGELTRSNNLDCNHKNKNILDCDPVNLEWLCRPCHRAKDRQTEKGVSVKADEFGYGI